MLNGRRARFACGTNLEERTESAEGESEGKEGTKLMSVSDLFAVHSRRKEEDESRYCHEEHGDVAIMHEGVLHHDEGDQHSRGG